jgi:hypothetical protein
LPPDSAYESRFATSTPKAIHRDKLQETDCFLVVKRADLEGVGGTLQSTKRPVDSYEPFLWLPSTEPFHCA